MNSPTTFLLAVLALATPAGTANCEERMETPRDPSELRASLRQTELDFAVNSEGLFNSVWKRQPDGTWLIVFDAGC